MLIISGPTCGAETLRIGVELQMTDRTSLERVSGLPAGRGRFPLADANEIWYKTGKQESVGGVAFPVVFGGDHMTPLWINYFDADDRGKYEHSFSQSRPAAAAAMMTLVSGRNTLTARPHATHHGFMQMEPYANYYVVGPSWLRSSMKWQDGVRGDPAKDTVLQFLVAGINDPRTIENRFKKESIDMLGGFQLVAGFPTCEAWKDMQPRRIAAPATRGAAPESGTGRSATGAVVAGGEIQQKLEQPHALSPDMIDSRHIVRVNFLPVAAHLWSQDTGRRVPAKLVATSAPKEAPAKGPFHGTELKQKQPGTPVKQF